MIQSTLKQTDDRSKRADVAAQSQEDSSRSARITIATQKKNQKKFCGGGGFINDTPTLHQNRC